MRKTWQPGRSKRRMFAAQMCVIDDFCASHGIHQSASSDSYYFTINGTNYRVSNHSVEASNRAAWSWDGELRRPLYHPDGRDANTVYIHASKTRIIGIYNDLMDGYSLDGHGNRKEN